MYPDNEAAVADKFWASKVYYSYYYVAFKLTSTFIFGFDCLFHPPYLPDVRFLGPREV
jgi:hypothetical protein